MAAVAGVVSGSIELSLLFPSEDAMLILPELEN